MITVKFTRYSQPDGQQRQVETDVADDLGKNVDMIHVAGARLTVELLSTREVSLAVEHPEHGDFDCELIANGPSVSGAIDRMIRRFDITNFEQWIDDMESEEAGK